MNNKKSIIAATIVSIAITMISCSSTQEPNNNYTPTNATMKEPGDKTGVAVVVDNSTGFGKFKEVTLTHPLDQGMVVKGKSIYDVKCSACHKLTDEKLVGPGWKSVTDRRKPEWIMNFSTNTDEMIDKDPSVQALLEKCMVRMPNQHLSDEDARHVLEFMRNNDGKN
jgi:mono/diheme cytochrome c family protein